jgi:hypothetical protein
MSGTCANRGSAASSARYSRICFGVFEMWSSPRTTSVIAMSMSSQTTDSW